MTYASRRWTGARAGTIGAAAAVFVAALAAACGRPVETPPRTNDVDRRTSSGTTASVGPAYAQTSEGDGAGPITGWLRTEGPRILLPNGQPFRGRGANVHDTRSCDACSWEPPRVEEVQRRIDVLTDEWRANFVRLLLESYPDKGAGQGRAHYRGVLEDEDYFRDVMRIIGHVGKKPGVYVLVSLWHEPSFGKMGWPTERTRAVWQKLARALADMPFVMFGLVNEPERNEDGKLDAEVWKAMNDTVAAIRSVERKDKPHLIAVQGTRSWARVLDYYVDHPITAGGGVNIVYETHVYDPKSRFDALVTRPAKTLPVIIGELGVVNDDNAKMSPDDVVALWDLAEKLGVPWMAYTFHGNCPPSLLDGPAGVCGIGAPLVPSAWGRMVKARLARPW